MARWRRNLAGLPEADAFSTTAAGAEVALKSIANALVAPRDTKSTKAAAVLLIAFIIRLQILQKIRLTSSSPLLRLSDELSRLVLRENISRSCVVVIASHLGAGRETELKHEMKRSVYAFGSSAANRRSDLRPCHRQCLLTADKLVFHHIGHPGETPLNT